MNYLGAFPAGSAFFGARRLLAVAALFVALFPALPATGEGSTGSDPEIELRKVQAALLYKFYFYVNGLPSQLSDRSTPFTIGILGEDPFGDYLNPVMGLEARGHPVRIHRSRFLDEIENCEIIFICRSERDRLGDIMTRLAGNPHVLVSDIDGFADQGGTIGFVLANGSVGFEINQRAAEAKRIRLSSRLLRLAERVVR